MAKIAPYLTFNGNCAEAFDFYADALGGKITMRMTYGEAPGDMQIPPEHAKLVMHNALSVGDAELMGADMAGRPYHAPQGISVMVELADAQAVHTAASRLAEGGQVTMPVTETFWTPAFGMVSDRFGVHWMLSVLVKS